MVYFWTANPINGFTFELQIPDIPACRACISGWLTCIDFWRFLLLFLIHELTESLLLANIFYQTYQRPFNQTVKTKTCCFYRFYSQQAHFNSFTARPVKEKKEICVSIKLEIYLHPSTTASIYPPDQHQQYVILFFYYSFPEDNDAQVTHSSAKLESVISSNTKCTPEQHKAYSDTVHDHVPSI